MLQQDKPQDFVIGTGTAHSVRDFCEKAFNCVNLDWENYVRYDPRYDRPAEVDYLLADPSKAEKELGWKRKIDFPELVEMMVHSDLESLKESNN